MPDLRYVLRYVITGYFVLAYTFAFFWIFASPRCFGTVFGYIMAKPETLAVGAVLAVPLGWLAFQLYGLRHHPKYRTEAFQLARRWANAEGIILEESDLEELVNVPFYWRRGDRGLEKEILETIRGYWDHYEARRTVAVYVPSISFPLGLLSAVALSPLPGTCVYQWFVWKSPCVVQLVLRLLCLILIVTISIITYWPTRRLMNEINSLLNIVVSDSELAIRMKMRRLARLRRSLPART